VDHADLTSRKKIGSVSQANTKIDEKNKLFGLKDFSICFLI